MNYPELTLANSAYRVAAHLTGGRQPYEMLPPPIQEQWLRLAGAAEQLFTDLDGKPMAKVLREAWRVWSGEDSWDQRTLEERLPFEAAVRHLYQMLDDQEELDLPAKEAEWADWAEARMEGSK